MLRSLSASVRPWLVPVFFCCASVVSAQTGATGAPAATDVGVTVFVEIAVENARGPVLDLRPEEVALHQQGVPQRIESLRKLETPGQYELSYAPNSGKAAGITVAIKRPRTGVRAPRGGMLQPRVVRNLTPLESALSRILAERPTANDFPCFVSALEFEAAPDGVHETLVLEVPVDALRGAARSSPPLQFFARVLDSNGRRVERFSFDLEAPPALPEDVGGERLIWTGGAHLAPGAYTVDAVVVDPSSSRASVRSFPLQVAAPKPGVRMSSVVVLQKSSIVLQDAARQADDPLYFGSEAVMPRLEPELPLADLVSVPFFLVVYADRSLAAPPQLEVELYRGDELRARAKVDTPAPDANGRLTYSGSMNAQRLQPGTYRARIVARQGEMAVSNDVSFVIVDRPPIRIGSHGPLAEGATPAVDRELVVAAALLRRGRGKEALAMLAERDQRTTGGCEDACLVALATAYYREGEYDKAQQTARRVVARSDDRALLAQCWEVIGRSQIVGLGRLDQKARIRAEAAQAAFGNVLDLSSGAHPYAFHKRTWLLLKLGRRAEAEKAIADAEAAGKLSQDDLARVRRFFAEPRCVDEPCAPIFSFSTSDGERRTLADLRGRVVLLSFWASWCGPCRSALPELARLEKRFAGDPFVLIGISADYQEGPMREALTRAKLSGPQVWDEDRQIADAAFGVHAWPTEVIIDHEGVVVHTQRGWGEMSGMRLSRAVHTAVDKAKKAAKARGAAQTAPAVAPPAGS